MKSNSKFRATKNISSKADDDSAGQTVPQITHKMVSVIDDSHKKPVNNFCWLPSRITIEGKKGTLSGPDAILSCSTIEK